MQQSYHNLAARLLMQMDCSVELPELLTNIAYAAIGRRLIMQPRRSLVQLSA
jgi:hypothetical protein